MQLFQLAKEQLKHIRRHLQEYGAVADEKRPLAGGVDIPMLHFSTSGKPTGLESGEARHFQGINLLVATQPDGTMDVAAIERGVNEFVALALLFAFTPGGKGYQHMHEAPDTLLMADPNDDKSLFLRFKNIKPDELKVNVAFQELDHLEELMFKGWRKLPGAHEPLFSKSFKNKEEALRVENLFEALGRAAGYTHEEIEQCFDTSRNDKTLTIYQDFLEQMTKVEQTLEADFSRRR